MTKLVKQQEWYIRLLEDIRKLEYTGIVLTKWNIGKRIVQDELKFGKPEYGSKKIENVARDLKISKTDLYNCIAFYKKCSPKIPTALENSSWHYISNFYLPTPRELSEEEIKNAETKILPPTLNLINQDFRKADIEENSADLILTDPPYSQEYLPLWKDLATFAYKVLKPSGFLVAYSGQYHLPEVFGLLNGKLEYVWTMAILLPGSTQIVNARNLMCGWKPILIYCKPPFNKRDTFYDVVTSPQGEKDYHDWQQSEGGVRKLIEIFSKEGDIILDPFSGAGTFPKVAYEMKRQAIGIEVNTDTHLKAKLRIWQD